MRAARGVDGAGLPARRGGRLPRLKPRPKAPEAQRFPPWPALFLALVAVTVYANTLANQYAFDDGVAIVENRHVQAGLRGIPDILAHDGRRLSATMRACATW